MSHTARIERTLEAAVALAHAKDAAPGLAAAIRYAVFPGGARVRPQLCLAVSSACGGACADLADAAAASIELLHCASLVHDDLPCFDDADLRRGKPTVHTKFGVPLALLAGDALIVMAFELLGRAGADHPAALPSLLTTIARGVGAPYGIVAGQAWECEASAPMAAYHQAKTGALFVAATTAGALAAGADPAPWRGLGEGLGAAYQVADDLLDALGDSEESGKTAGRDQAMQRPSAVTSFGVQGAVALLESHLDQAAASIPECEGAKALRETVRVQATRLVPKQLSRTAA
ncbi:polyprenyl synthetase family protein [Candidatus Phycosocius spiralis]|uniref:Geranylgeranyl pyrophosphate synthase n=1 Tax=Candidatus Phycosocius spiralis TaxID=2815099 RepID=A0ABQ4PU70_9PROT|nr:polyprenyl synthetase family protein [Candidatus Phycosocius spiralis]GIU66572.1 geranylgeranyl pyrophosphate synthase [Candidatus Phycosocius spiralis]